MLTCINDTAHAGGCFLLTPGHRHRMLKAILAPQWCPAGSAQRHGAELHNQHWWPWSFVASVAAAEVITPRSSSVGKGGSEARICFLFPAAKFGGWVSRQFPALGRHPGLRAARSWRGRCFPGRSRCCCSLCLSSLCGCSLSWSRSNLCPGLFLALFQWWVMGHGCVVSCAGDFPQPVPVFSRSLLFSRP